MGRWVKGKSGNPRGRPKKGTAIADLARSQVEKHRLVEKLGSMAAGDSDFKSVALDQRLRAIQLLLAYGYGPPRNEIEAPEGVVIQVNYVQRNQSTITSAAPGADACDSGGQTV